MIGFANLHILTVRHGEVYVHHFWLLVILVAWIFSCGKAYVGRSK